ncbi:hypothetical protein [Micromonospora sp. DT31]|uniref:hypothetical protein n=1 Tax=Micromonospora sp. DT31 TaxID=3393434 RepID=UPI003CF97285
MSTAAAVVGRHRYVEPRRGLLGRLFFTVFGRVTLGCLLLAGWAGWTGGIMDGPVARQVRTSSVYVAPGVDLDRAQAERIVGNRRLVVLVMAPGADLRDACRDTKSATGGTLTLAMSRDGDDWDTYGCSRFRYEESGDFGKAVVAETTIGRGADAFVDRPVEAMKVIVLNYDRLVRAGIVPDGARVLSPPLPRYLLAGGAVLGVLSGAAALWWGGRRAGRLADARQAARAERRDTRGALSAAMAGIAQQIMDLDRAGRPAVAYASLAVDYVDLVERMSALDEQDTRAVRQLWMRVEELTERASAVTGGGSDPLAGDDPAAVVPVPATGPMTRKGRGRERGRR